MSAIAWTTIKPALLDLFSDLADLQCVWLDKSRPIVDPAALAIVFLWVKSCNSYGTDDRRETFNAALHSTQSTVSLTCTLSAGTKLLAGVHFASDGANRWTPVADYTATETEAQPVPFCCEFPGPMAAAVGAIDTIDTGPTSGWTACVNALAATPGVVGTEYQTSIEGLRRVVLGCRVESFKQDDSGFAFQAIESIRSGLDWPSSKAAIRAVDCALVGHELSNDIPNVIVDNRVVSIAQADVILCAPACSVDPVGATWIETLAPINVTVS